MDSVDVTTGAEPSSQVLESKPGQSGGGKDDGQVLVEPASAFSGGLGVTRRSPSIRCPYRLLSLIPALAPLGRKSPGVVPRRRRRPLSSFRDQYVSDAPSKMTTSVFGEPLPGRSEDYRPHTTSCETVIGFSSDYRVCNDPSVCTTCVESPRTPGWELRAITHDNSSSESSTFDKGMRRPCALWFGIREKSYPTGSDVSAFGSNTQER
ncbi:hypothetical protein MRX96_017950 [Rhipicephalus microplus]